MTTEQIISLLVSAIKSHGGKEIASRLGYKSRGALYNWIKRNSVPSYMEDKLQTILKEVNDVSKGRKKKG